MMTLERQLLDALPAYLFVLDEHLAILDHNAAAGRLLDTHGQAVLSERMGKALRCIHNTDPAGCGHGPHCDSCLVRASVREALAADKPVRRRVRLELRSEAGIRELFGLITATPLVLEDRRAVLLAIDDIGELIELQGLIPICMYCKQIRDDRQYWSQVEAYLREHLDLQFSHGICPTCFEKLKADLLARGPGQAEQ